MNDKLEHLVTKEVLPLRITEYALEKGNLIASTTKELCNEYSLPAFEVAFYLLTTKEEAKDKQPLITDVYIGKHQDVNTDYCAIPGNGGITSLRDIKYNLGLRVAGLGHSHGDHPTFFSGRDVETFTRFVKDHFLYAHLEEDQTTHEPSRFIDVNGETYLEIGNYNTIRITHPSFNNEPLETLNTTAPTITHHQEADLNYSYAIVFNAKNDEPHAVIGYARRKGPVILQENVPLHIEPSTKSALEEKNIVERQLLERVDQLREAQHQSKKSALKEFKHFKNVLQEIGTYFTHFNEGNVNKKEARKAMKGLQYINHFMRTSSQKKDRHQQALNNYLTNTLQQFSQRFSLPDELFNMASERKTNDYRTKQQSFKKALHDVNKEHGLYHERDKRDTQM